MFAREDSISSNELLSYGIVPNWTFYQRQKDSVANTDHIGLHMEADKEEMREIVETAEILEGAINGFQPSFEQ